MKRHVLIKLAATTALVCAVPFAVVPAVPPTPDISFAPNIKVQRPVPAAADHLTYLRWIGAPLYESGVPDVCGLATVMLDHRVTGVG